MTSFLDTSPLPAYEQTLTKEAIKSLRREERTYRQGLDQEGVWLFLSTVGCWGVPHEWFQAVAFALTGWLFGKLMLKHYSDAKSFSSATQIIELRIGAEVTDPMQQQAELLELHEFRNRKLRSWRPYWLSRVFLTCWLFYGFSFAFALYKSVATIAGAA